MMHSEFHIYGDIDESVRTGIGTRVVHKLNGRWRTVAVQNTTYGPAVGTKRVAEIVQVSWTLNSAGANARSVYGPEPTCRDVRYESVIGG
jgi:hypothetical protein